MDQASFLQAAAGGGDDFDDDGFSQAKPRRRRNTRRQHKQAVGSDWVWGADPLQDWLSSSPVWDWQRQQWMLHSMQQWESAANGSYDDNSSTAAADSDPGPSSSSRGIAAGGIGREHKPGAARSTTVSSSNAFSVLAGFGDGADGTDDPDALLARLEVEGAISEGSGSAFMPTTDSTEGAFMPTTDRTDAAAAAGAQLFAQPAGGFGEWMLLSGENQPGGAAAAAAGEAAAVDTADSTSDDGWEVAGLSDSDAGGDDATSSTGSPTGHQHHQRLNFHQHEQHHQQQQRQQPYRWSILKGLLPHPPRPPQGSHPHLRLQQLLLLLGKAIQPVWQVTRLAFPWRCRRWRTWTGQLRSCCCWMM